MAMASHERFLRLFLAHEREIYRYVAALVPSTADTQDIVQQTAVVLWEKFDQYDPDRPFAPWAFRFSLNVARQWMDRQKRWKAVLDQGLAEELVSRREQLRPEIDARLAYLEKCMAKLRDDQKALIEGYYHKQLDVETMATEFRRTTGAIYKSLQRIRHQLQACIEKFRRREVAS